MNDVTRIIEENSKQQDSKQKQDRPAFKADWTPQTYLVATKDAEGGSSVKQVSQQDLHSFVGSVVVCCLLSSHRPFAYHRFQFGTIVGTGKFVPSVSPRVEGWRSGAPVVDEAAWWDIGALLEAAKKWQETDAMVQADQYVSRSMPREDSSKSVRHTGKTERNRARGKAKPKTS
jgi:hypothetical protein